MRSDEIGVWFPTVKTGTGSEIYTIRLVAALKKRGIKAEIAWLPHYAEYFPWLVPVPEVPSWVTVVHINTWLHSRFVPKHLPLVATVHSATYDPVIARYKKFFQRIYHKNWVYRLEKRNLDVAQVITAVSAFVARQTEVCFGVRQIDVIYNWIDTDVFHAKKNVNPSNCNDIFEIVFVGATTARKGFDLLPRIMQKLGPSFRLRFTASSPDLFEKGAVVENMIPVRRIDKETELADFYRSADALLFPSRGEGFGLVVLEALACGTPVVTTNGSALSEIVQDGVTGYLCALDDVDDFVAALRKIAGDRHLAKNLEVSAGEVSQKKFSEEIALQKYINHYLRLSYSKL